MKKTMRTMLCGIAALAASTGAFAAEPIKIGAIFSVTGPASFLGEPEKNTAKMLEEQINKAGGLLGRPVEIVVYDDESDPTKAVTAVDRLIKMDGVVAIVGPSTTGSTLAVAPKAIAAKIPLISCAAAKKIVDPVNPWVFKTPQHDALAVKKIYQNLQATGSRTWRFSPPRTLSAPRAVRSSRALRRATVSPWSPTRSSGPRTPT